MTDEALTSETIGGAVDPAPARTARRESEVREVVREIVIEIGPERADPTDATVPLVDGLGYNSLALVELAFTLEDEFDLAPIDEVTARRIDSLQAVQDHVVAELADRGELVADG